VAAGAAAGGARRGGEPVRGMSPRPRWSNEPIAGGPMDQLGVGTSRATPVTVETGWNLRGLVKGTFAVSGHALIGPMNRLTMVQWTEGTVNGQDLRGTRRSLAEGQGSRELRSRQPLRSKESPMVQWTGGGRVIGPPTANRNSSRGIGPTRGGPSREPVADRLVNRRRAVSPFRAVSTPQRRRVSAFPRPTAAGKNYPPEPTARPAIEAPITDKSSSHARTRDQNSGRSPVTGFRSP
jgi:hypothetical protein